MAEEVVRKGTLFKIYTFPLEVSIRTYVSVRVRNIRDRSHEISFILASNSNGGFLPNPQTSLNGLLGDKWENALADLSRTCFLDWLPTLRTIIPS